jgi:hypothetical protein
MLKANTMQIPVPFVSPMIDDHHSNIIQNTDILMGYFNMAPGRTEGLAILSVMNLPCYVGLAAGQIDL